MMPAPGRRPVRPAQVFQRQYRSVAIVVPSQEFGESRRSGLRVHTMFDTQPFRCVEGRPDLGEGRRTVIESHDRPLGGYVSTVYLQPRDRASAHQVGESFGTRLFVDAHWMPAPVYSGSSHAQILLPIGPIRESTHAEMWRSQYEGRHARQCSANNAG